MLGGMNIAVSWLMQQLVDTASGAAGARPLAQLTAMCVGFVLLCAGLYLVYDLALPRFLSRAMRQYQDVPCGA